jgi:plastocyanin
MRHLDCWSGCRTSSSLHPWVVIAVLSLTGIAAACGGGEAPPQNASPAAAPNPVDPATAGTVSGHITLEGTPPPAQSVKTASDPRCTDPVTTEEVLVGTGAALKNVFVYVKDGLGDRVFPVPSTAVVLEQQGCTYRPHVFGIQVGQTLEILNSDATLHNIHAMPMQNADFNKAQQFKGQKDTHLFSAKEIIVPFKCNVHKWMSAYVGVVDHPFFAVTGNEGAFELKGLPPGTYMIEAVHEKLGKQTGSVTVAAKGTATVDFSFKI